MKLDGIIETITSEVKTKLKTNRIGSENDFKEKKSKHFEK